MYLNLKLTLQSLENVFTSEPIIKGRNILCLYSPLTLNYNKCSVETIIEVFLHTQQYDIKY